MDCKVVKCSVEHHNIEICNLSDTETVCHSVIVINGKVNSKCNCPAVREVIVERIDGPCVVPSVTKHSLTTNLCFKYLTKLESGMNIFLLKYCSVELRFTLNYETRPTDFVVLPMYIICKGHDGRFQAPENEDNAIDSACDRIDTGIRLIQSLIADQLFKTGYGRRTFQLQSDKDPTVPNCHVFYSQTSVEEAHASDMNTLWENFGREIMESPLGKKNHKFVAFLSSTWYDGKLLNGCSPTHDDIKKCTAGHVALGGGGLALFGTGCLHTWATSVDEVILRLMSAVCVDTSKFMDDSNGRGTYGGCYSSTLGAVCHEIGHVFDLGHTTYGIMGREYHNVGSLFLPEGEELKRSIALHDSNGEIMQASTNPCTLTTFVEELKLQTEISPKDSSNTVLVFDSQQSKVDSNNFVKFNQTHTVVAKIQRGVNKMEVPNYLKPNFDSLDRSPFWSQSCSALLAYNKWLNPDALMDEDKGLVFNPLRNEINSKHCLRLVEIRDKSSKSILHWVLSKTSEFTQFFIPKQYISTKASSLCIIDSVGNVIKPDLLVS